MHQACYDTADVTARELELVSDKAGLVRRLRAGERLLHARGEVRALRELTEKVLPSGETRRGADAGSYEQDEVAPGGSVAEPISVLLKTWVELPPKVDALVN
ncbi:hypothetical protein AYO39_00245 [Actinobacteria bacterium SCGC AG-212-D09]|nr:hypothetical protein AYO39_00245 [Actinobacteria bacterium SCGC AG-212-D09]